MNALYRRRVAAALLVIFSVSTISPCAITIVNNTQYAQILIVDKNSGLAEVITPNSTPAVFGNPDQRAHFFVLVPQAGSPGFFEAKVVVTQKACMPSHKITLNVSDLLNLTVNTNAESQGFFVAEQYSPKMKETRMHTPEEAAMHKTLRDQETISVAQNDRQFRSTGYRITAQQERETSGLIPNGDGGGELTEDGMDLQPRPKFCGTEDCCEGCAG